MKNKVFQNPQIVQVHPPPCTLLPTPLLLGSNTRSIDNYSLPVTPPAGHLSVFIYLIIRYFKKYVWQIITTSIIILYICKLIHLQFQFFYNLRPLR